MKKTILVGSLISLLAGGLVSSPSPLQAQSPQPKPSPAASPVTAQAPTKTETVAETAAETAAEAPITLLSAGAEPRQELRFTPAANLTQTTQMTMKMDMVMSMAGQTIPGLELPGNIVTYLVNVTQIDANGDIHYEARCTDIAVTEGENVIPAVRSQIEAQLQNVIGSGGTFVIDNRGNIKQADLVLPENADPMMQQVFEQLSSSMQQLSTPFPTESVGLGAKWSMSYALTMNGLNFMQNVTYELVDLQDNVATLNIGIEQQADAQTVDAPGLPPGAKITLNEMRSQGSGQVIMQLDRLMPVGGSLSMQTDTDMTVSPGSGVPDSPVSTQMNMQMNWQSD
jgi:Family of unknown function (DUF6263)